MDDYHLLGGGVYELSDSGGIMDDPSHIVGGVGYGSETSQTIASSGMIPSQLSPSEAHSPGQMISSIMTRHPHDNAESYQMGIQQVYQENDILHKFQHYGSYENISGMVSNQFSSGGRLQHVNNSSIPPPGDQQTPRPLTPSQISNYEQENILPSQYAQLSQQTSGPSINIGQSASQYPGYSRGTVPHQQQLDQTGDIWQGTMLQQHGYQYMPQGPSYSHTSQPTPLASMQRCIGSVGNVAVPMQVPRSTTPNQYMSRQEFTVPSPSQTTADQLQTVYTVQPSLNEPYMNQMCVPVSQPLSHIPVAQSEHGMSSYSAQGQHSLSFQPGGTRPCYSPSSSLNAINPGDSATMQKAGYSPYSHLNSGQQPITPIQQASSTTIQQYPQQSYSPTKSYHHQSSQHQASILGRSSPSQLSPYSQVQQPSQTPNSPQYHPGFLLSQVHVSPRQPTPPADSPMSASHTPDRVPYPPTSTTPHSQGSYPSPVTGHLSSPHQGLSPGGGKNGPSSSLQQLEQMVMPHIAGSSNSKASTPNSSMSSSMTGHPVGMIGASYYSSVGQDQLQQVQQHAGCHPSPSVYPQSHASRQYGHQQYIGQPGVPVPTLSASVNNSVGYVPNSLSLQASGPTVMNDGVRSVSIPPAEVAVTTSVTFSASSNGNIMHSSSSVPDMSCSYTQDALVVASNHTSISTTDPPLYPAPTAYDEWNMPLNYEVHNIQQELQHLYSLPQSPQSQQK
ncbi:uncharacterized protein LOC106464110, partial [Limulus polyphemus]|uniref:Uncharacterized protein LOC106464110 n=1 Tax=Limulus polyphemus TaxID=6850 RepID=A0ABM1BDA8_LIMPO